MAINNSFQQKLKKGSPMPPEILLLSFFFFACSVGELKYWGVGVGVGSRPQTQAGSYFVEVRFYLCWFLCWCRHRLMSLCFYLASYQTYFQTMVLTSNFSNKHPSSQPKSLRPNQPMIHMMCVMGLSFSRMSWSTDKCQRSSIAVQ